VGIRRGKKRRREMASTPSDQDDVLLKIERSACKIKLVEE